MNNKDWREVKLRDVADIGQSKQNKAGEIK